MAEQSILSLLKRALELAMPDLRAYYRMTRKAKIVASYASDGRYFADVQPLRNDESPDQAEPVIPQVEIPIMWGGPKRGIVCPPAVGTLCDLSYYDGDPNYPRISNFRWQSNSAPDCGFKIHIVFAAYGMVVRFVRAWCKAKAVKLKICYVKFRYGVESKSRLICLHILMTQYKYRLHFC